MRNPKTNLSNLRRPKLLIRAARAGIADYRKTRNLRCLKGGANITRGPYLVENLIQEESRLNEERAQQDAAYSVRKHIQILAALMVEVDISNHQELAA